MKLLLIYCTVKGIGSKIFGEFGELQQFANFITNFDYYHNIPYANRLQFIKVFSSTLPIVLIRQTFIPPKFSTIQYLLVKRDM